MLRKLATIKKTRFIKAGLILLRGLQVQIDNNPPGLSLSLPACLSICCIGIIDG